MRKKMDKRAAIDEMDALKSVFQLVGCLIFLFELQTVTPGSDPLKTWRTVFRRTNGTLKLLFSDPWELGRGSK